MQQRRRERGGGVKCGLGRHLRRTFSALYDDALEEGLASGFTLSVAGRG
ncbi:hypothetical protein J2X03_001282 [Microbacterium trichothecenolyticum]|nr:hypothetical protein [Microbacterium trichothecenolyticum]